MIDLHAHFLPAMDDGAQNAEISIKMLEESAKQGVSVCAATPHCVIHKQEDIDRFLKNREYSAGLLKAELEQRKFAHPKLIFGAEIFLDNDLNEYTGLHRLCIDDTDYILLEFGSKKDNRKCADWLYSMTLKGLKPIIAHIDRYPDFEKMIAEFKGLNLVYQINAGRFLSVPGRMIIRRLMEYDNTYFVSSDMHNVVERSCNMQPAFQKALKKFPQEAENWFELNGKKILNV